LKPAPTSDGFARCRRDGDFLRRRRLLGQNRVRRPYRHPLAGGSRLLGVALLDS
jgi:hypothetical protein